MCYTHLLCAANTKCTFYQCLSMCESAHNIYYILHIMYIFVYVQCKNKRRRRAILQNLLIKLNKIVFIKEIN